MIEVRAQAQLEKALKKTNNGADELIVCLGGGHFTLWGNSTATLRENSTATLWGNSTATLWGNSTATLRENSTATLWGNSTATLRENSTATLRENSTATLRGNSTATLRENSTATLWGNSTATLWGNSTATLRENSTATLRENSTATLRENSTATLWGNSTATLWGNSTATLWGNSTATLWGNSTATLWGNSTATLWENSTATLWGNSTGQVDARPHSHIRRHPASTAKISGGVVLDMFVPRTGAEWCDFYGVEIRKGGKFSRKLAGQDVAILFKSLPDDLTAWGNFQYEIGKTPTAPDWDGGKRECGGGLHFSPSPVHAESFCDPGRYIACPVLVSDICVHPDGSYPEKVKAPGCCAPIWEVDRDGKAIELAEAEAQS